MEQQIKDIICDIVKLAPEELEQRLEDRTAWDSLKRIEAIFAIEEELDIHFSESDIAEAVTPGALLRIAGRLVEEA